MDDFILMSLPDLIKELAKLKWKKIEMAKMMGITPLQVWYYETGKTKKPSVKVCSNIYNKVKINGKPVLIDLYSSYDELQQHLKVYELYGNKNV